MKLNWRSLLVCIGAAATVLGASVNYMHEAQALTPQDIVVMHSQGVPDSVLISVIQNAQDIAKLDKSDYDTLKAQGVSQQVLSEIAMRIKALESEEQTPQTDDLRQSGQETPTTDVDETPTEPDSSTWVKNKENTQTETTSKRDAPGIPPVEQKALIPPPTLDSAAIDETQTNAEIGTEVPNEAAQIVQGTVLSPIETSNAILVLDKFFQELESTFRLEAEMARRYATLRNETHALEDAMSELPAVAKYRREIRDGDSVRALDSCMSMSKDIAPNANTAIGAALNQCIGESLGALGAYGMGAAYLDAALQADAVVDDYAATFKTFLDYARRSDYSSAAPLRIAAHENEILHDPSIRDEYRYFVAYSLVYGSNPNVDMAYRTLGQIEPHSLEYARAQLLMAALDVRTPALRFKTAVERIGNALATLEKIDGDTAYQLKNTAWLALARIAAENHAYDSAVEFYRNVDVNSHRLRDSLVEQAWTEIFAKRYSHALALTHAMRAPIFSKIWNPDLLLIEANAFLGLCRYADAERAIEALRATYIADADTLSRLVAETSARDYYGQILRHAKSPQTSPLPDRVYARVLSSLTFKRVHQSLRTLNRERENLSRHVSQNFTSWPELEKAYDAAITYRQAAISQVLSSIYSSTVDDIHALDVSASQVAIEIKLSQRKREAACLKIVAAGGKCVPLQTVATPETTKASDEVFWTFDREFWRDELRSYVAALPSMCPATE